MRGAEGVVHALAAVDSGITVHAVDHLCEATEYLDPRLLQLHADGDRKAPPTMPAKIAKIR